MICEMDRTNEHSITYDEREELTELTLKPVAYIQSDFHEKFGIPRQSGLASELMATVVFTPEFRSPEAVRGLSE